MRENRTPFGDIAQLGELYEVSETSPSNKPNERATLLVFDADKEVSATTSV